MIGNYFSKFVPRGSIRVDSYNVGTGKTPDDERPPATGDEVRVEHVAFVTPSGDRVIVAINQGEKPIELSVIDDQEQSEQNSEKKTERRKRVARLKLPADSIITALWHSHK